MANPAIVLLAAGSSSRFGQPKQLALYEGKSFICRVLTEAQKITTDITVVLGAEIDLIKTAIEEFQVHIVPNANWADGMSSSLNLGLSELLKRNPSLDVVLFMVCDQPFVTSSVLGKLIIAYQETQKPIVACAYGNTVGTPVLFDKLFFPALLALTGQAGAKKIIAQYPGHTATIPFPMGSIDIDTAEEYKNLLNHQFASDHGTL